MYYIKINLQYILMNIQYTKIQHLSVVYNIICPVKTEQFILNVILF